MYKSNKINAKIFFLFSLFGIAGFTGALEDDYTVVDGSHLDGFTPDLDIQREFRRLQEQLVALQEQMARLTSAVEPSQPAVESTTVSLDEQQTGPKAKEVALELSKLFGLIGSKIITVTKKAALMLAGEALDFRSKVELGKTIKALQIAFETTKNAAKGAATRAVSALLRAIRTARQEE